MDWARTASYRVYPFPLQDPDGGARQLELDPQDPVASPFGWHDTDGVPGADFTDTQGNNVLTQEDADADDLEGFRPTGGADLSFDFPLDLTQDPGTYQAAAVTNLFYWANVLHDIHYRYGFDEAAGNFQSNNYEVGGFDGDPLIADAQDGAELNNAVFMTPPDGASPRMEMYLWTQPAERLRITAPPALVGDYPAGAAQFGPLLTDLGITGTVVQALDAVEAGGGFTATDACSAPTNAVELNGEIALIDCGECLFVEKVVNVQATGAIAAIIVNNQGDQIIQMGGVDPAITIPSLFIGESDGALIKASLADGVVANLSRQDLPSLRDSSLASGTIIHEYGHGVSSRLTGGPSNASCLSLNQASGMAEGWSDFWSLALTAKTTDTRAMPRGTATFLVDERTTAGGIRNFPYSTDLNVNPQTYADIAATNVPHGVGEIWVSALWEVYWNLVDEHGFDSDPYTGAGGNNLVLQLVMDSLKLQSCQPSFLDGRDALLLADLNLTGGANDCAIWTGFAKRGMGFAADDGGTASSLLVTESFAAPIPCPEPSDLALQLAALAALAVGSARRRGRLG